MSTFFVPQKTSLRNVKFEKFTSASRFNPIAAYSYRPLVCGQISERPSISFVLQDQDFSMLYFAFIQLLVAIITIGAVCVFAYSKHIKK